MTPHAWAKDGLNKDGEQMWRCPACGRREPSWIGEEPPMVFTEAAGSLILPLDDCSKEKDREVQRVMEL